ncbi:Cuticle protein 6, partial [Frankliniella fusca]
AWWCALALAGALLAATTTSADPTPDPSPAPTPAGPSTTSSSSTTTTMRTTSPASSTSSSSPIPVDPLLEAEEDAAEDVAGGGPNKREDRDMERGQDRDDQTTREQHQVAILKQINRVNEDGSYTFGYEAADGSFKIETRDVLGHVKGMFGFIDEKGQLKRVSYTAANGTGFQADPTPPGAAAAGTAPQPLPGAVYQQVIRPTARRRPSAVRLVVAPPTSTPRPAPSSQEARAAADPVIQQIPRRGGLSSTASPTASPTPAGGGLSSTRAPGAAPGRPVLVLATPAPGPDGSTPTPAPYGQFVRRTEQRRPVLVLAAGGGSGGGAQTTAASTATTSTTAAPVTEDSASGEASDGRRDREGNELRRQLPLPPLPPLPPLSGLAADRDIDPLGLAGAAPGAHLLRLLAPAGLGRGDTGDVYGGGGGHAAAGAGAGAVPPGLHALGSQPHFTGVLRQGPRALQQQLLQQHILADLDLTPRPRPPQEYADDYYGPGAVPAPALEATPQQAGRAAPTVPPPPPPALPPLQLEPAVAMALEQFLISRGIRLRPYRPVPPYAPPPPPPPYHPMMRYRPPPYSPYYDEDPYGYDPYLAQRHAYHMYHRGYAYDPYAYQQPYPYSTYPRLSHLFPQAQAARGLQLYDSPQGLGLPSSIVTTTQAPPSTSARVRNVKILEPDAEGSELSPTTVKPDHQ